MASNFFQNNTVDLNTLWFGSHKKLIKRVLAEVDASDRQDEIIKKFLAEPLKIKKQKDPLMPKRQKSSFLYFCDEHRNQIRTKNKGLSMGGVMKELGQLWAKCECKEKYEKLSKEAKQDYEERMEEYNDNNCYD
jgi:hypothetical protein